MHAFLKVYHSDKKKTNTKKSHLKRQSHVKGGSSIFMHTVNCSALGTNFLDSALFLTPPSLNGVNDNAQLYSLTNLNMSGANGCQKSRDTLSLINNIRSFIAEQTFLIFLIVLLICIIIRNLNYSSC